MPNLIGVVSQKGGVGKSTLCRLLAREYAAADWSVKVADLDVKQSTSFAWQGRRLQAGIDPDVPVERFSSVTRALKHAQSYDLMILDGAPHSSKATLEIAKASDAVLLPTGLALDDLEPSVLLAHELVKAGVSKRRLAFTLLRVGESESEQDEARRYINDAGYGVLSGSIPEKTAYRRASDEGRVLTETRFGSLNARADEVAQGAIDFVSPQKKNKGRR